MQRNERIGNRGVLAFWWQRLQLALAVRDAADLRGPARGQVAEAQPQSEHGMRAIKPRDGVADGFEGDVLGFPKSNA